MNCIKVIWMWIVLIVFVWGGTVDAHAVSELSLIQGEEEIQVWTGEIADRFAGGDGSKENPYQIASAEQLAKLSNDVSKLGIEYAEQYFVLTQNIAINRNVIGILIDADMHAYRALNRWEPIGTDEHSFKGLFDGAGHTISGLVVESDDEVGLFGVIRQGCIENITLEDAYVSGRLSVGGICGKLIGSEVKNCLFDGLVTGSNNVGGICGRIVNSSIYSSCNIGAISGTNGVGGICGDLCVTDPMNGEPVVYYIEGCINYGEISGRSVAGICGDDTIQYAYGGGRVLYSANYGNIYGGYSAAGIGTRLTIQDCYNVGNIEGYCYADGISTSGSVSNCYNVGLVYANETHWVECEGIGGTVCEDSYYLEGIVPDFVTSKRNDYYKPTEVTADQFVYGEVLNLLNEENVWHQVIGQDPCPVLDCYRETVHYLYGQYVNGHTVLWYPDIDGSTHYGVCIYCESRVENEKHVLSHNYLCIECGYAAPVNEIRAFVERCYEKILGREGESAGIEFWVDELVFGRSTAAQAAASFVFSQEFVEQNNSDEIFLDRLYATFFDRVADPSGMEFWLNYLQGGVTREYVTAQFVNSAEFAEVCTAYGMQRGSIELSGYVNFNPNLTMYVVRCYREIHGRDADPSGLEFWCEMIATGQRDATHVARSFVDSQEFIEKNLPDTEYMEVLYRAFMGRTSDPSGLAFWLGELEKGCSRMEVLDRFADCVEFDMILDSFGL